MSVKPNILFGGNSRNNKDLKNSTNQVSFHNQNNHSFNVSLLERNKTSYNLNNKGINVINLKSSLNSSWKDKNLFYDKSSVNKMEKKVVVMSPIEENKDVKTETINSMNKKQNINSLQNSINESQFKKKNTDNKSTAVVVKNKDFGNNSINSKYQDLSDKNTDFQISTIVDNTIDLKSLTNEIYKELEKLKSNDIEIVKKVTSIYKQNFSKFNIKNSSLYALILPLLECREKTVNFSFLDKLRNKDKKMNSINYNSKNNVEKVSLGPFNNINNNIFTKTNSLNSSNLKYNSTSKQESNAFKKKLPVNNKEKNNNNDILKEPFSNEIENSKMISLSSSTNFKEFKKIGLNANQKNNFSKDSSMNLNNSSNINILNNKSDSSNVNLKMNIDKNGFKEIQNSNLANNISKHKFSKEKFMTNNDDKLHNQLNLLSPLDKMNSENTVIKLNSNLNAINVSESENDIKSLKSKVQILEEYVYTKKEEQNNIVNFVFCNKSDNDDIKLNLIQSRNKHVNITESMTFNDKVLKNKDRKIDENSEDNMRKTYAFDKDFADLESEKRTKINTKLINDLEAIYFEDKVCGKNKSHSIGIPKLNFDFNNEGEISKNSIANPVKANNILNNSKFNVKIQKKK